MTQRPFESVIHRQVVLTVPQTMRPLVLAEFCPQAWNQSATVSPETGGAFWQGRDAVSCVRFHQDAADPHLEQVGGRGLRDRTGLVGSRTATGRRRFIAHRAYASPGICRPAADLPATTLGDLKTHHERKPAAQASLNGRQGNPDTINRLKDGIRKKRLCLSFFSLLNFQWVFSVFNFFVCVCPS